GGGGTGSDYTSHNLMDGRADVTGEAGEGGVFLVKTYIALLHSFFFNIACSQRYFILGRGIYVTSHKHFLDDKPSSGPSHLVEGTTENDRVYLQYPQYRSILDTTLKKSYSKVIKPTVKEALERSAIKRSYIFICAIYIFVGLLGAGGPEIAATTECADYDNIITATRPASKPSGNRLYGGNTGCQTGKRTRLEKPSIATEKIPSTRLPNYAATGSENVVPNDGPNILSLFIL
ncbi:hypothetical protein J6590_008284, partial [Homalodisca vitripennis]